MSNYFDRSELKIKPLKERVSKIDNSNILALDNPLPSASSETIKKIERLTQKIQTAKNKRSPVIFVYGAHLFRNGLSPFIIELAKAGFINHLLTNGAGVIHDWELSYLGETTEDVSRYMKEGQFGIWQETGLYQNLAILLGAASGLGYGYSIGKMMAEEQLKFPSTVSLKKEIQLALESNQVNRSISSKTALLETIERLGIADSTQLIPHKFKEYSIVYNAYQSRIPFGVCPGIGYDIIYTHPANSGAAIGEAALSDFLELANSLTQLENGVIVVVGSAVMASQVIEKAFSMAKNVCIQKKAPLDNFYIAVSDIQPGNWNWSKGEPPIQNPAYYLRFCKSFSRLGGEFDYLELDNRVFVQHLYNQLFS